MIYKVGICGVTGRIGLELADLLRTNFVHQGTVLEFTDAVAGSLKIVSVEGIEVRTLEEQSPQPVHIWIDFSRPEVTLKLLSQIDTPIVIGTTGFNDSQFEEIRQYAQTKPVLLASNMSPGMNLVMEWLSHTPLKDDFPFDAFLEESHHRYKKDSPSGTAKTLLGILKDRGYQNVPSHVIRAGSIAGIHTVKLISDDEIIEIKHQALNRQVFARGALLGAIFLLKQQLPGLYTMKDVFFNKE